LQCLKDNANDVPKLQRLGIRAVLNLCPDCLQEAPYFGLPGRLEDAGIAYLQIHASDHSDFDMRQAVLPAGCAFIDANLKRGGVLVNCWGGEVYEISHPALSGTLELR